MGPPTPAGQAEPERRDTVRSRTEPDGHLRTGPAAAWHVLRQRNFGPYFVGNAASASGTWFQNLAASIVVYRLTHSPFLLGVLQFAQWIPVILLVPWTGSVADRVDRRRLLVATQTSSAVLSAALAAFAATGNATLGVVIGISVGIGIAQAFTQPAQMAMVSSLVSPEDLPQAVALNSMTFNIARAAGPASAAAVIASFGIATAFAVNAVSYILLVAGVLLVRPGVVERPERASVMEGIRLLRAEPRLMLNLGVVAALTFASDPINTESPALAHAFGFSANWAGTVVGAFGVGAVAGALLLAGRIVGTRSRMALTLGGFALGNVLFAASPWLELGWAFLALSGFSYLVSNTSATTRLQLGVSAAVRGRVMAIWSIAFLGLRPVSSLIDGAVGGAFGVRTAAAVMALPAFVGALLAARGAIGGREPPPGAAAREETVLG